VIVYLDPGRGIITCCYAPVVVARRRCNGLMTLGLVLGAGAFPYVLLHIIVGTTSTVLQNSLLAVQLSRKRNI
jgi:hypothetical protein